MSIRIRSLVPVFCFALTALPGCSGRVTDPTDADDDLLPRAAAKEDTSGLSQSQIDERLEAAAVVLAPQLSDSAFRQALEQSIAERRTGDYEVLFHDVADLRLADGRTLRDLLAPTGVLELETAHVAAPFGSALGDARNASVTWVPTTDEEAETLTYVAADGTRTTAPATEEPGRPVFVVAMNERVDAPGGFDTIGKTSQAAGSCPVTTCRTAKVTYMKIFDDHEPWTKGDPEIYMRCKDLGTTLGNDSYDVLYGELDLPGVNDEDHAYTIDSKTLMSYLPRGYGVKCWVAESDGTDGDDSLGSVTVYYEDGVKTYEVSDAIFKLK